MHTMVISVLWCFGAIAPLALIVSIIRARDRIPYGFEDDTGFHLGKPHR